MVNKAIVVNAIRETEKSNKKEKQLKHFFVSKYWETTFSEVQCIKECLNGCRENE